jgi:hypothetical protein
MNRLFLNAAVIVVLSLVFAEKAQACWECCVPPPYTRAQCCTSICGGTGCEASSGSGSSFCAASGACSENAEYCGAAGHGPRNRGVWVRCEPPLAERWKLTAVKVVHPVVHSVAGATKRG